MSSALSGYVDLSKYNNRSNNNMAVSASIIGAIGALGSTALGVLGNRNQTSSMSLEDQIRMSMLGHFLDLHSMKKQQQYNEKNMQLQDDYNRKLQEEQFEYNKWFNQNTYQNAVNSMRESGLNPLLLSGNSPSMGSVSGTQVGMGSSSALGSTVFDPSNALNASSNSSNSKIAKMQLALNGLNAVSDIALKASQTKKAQEEALTENSKRGLYNADIFLKDIQADNEKIINSHLDEKIKSEILLNNNNARSAIMNAITNQFVGSASAESMRKQAEAAMINATSGNIEKFGIDLFKKYFPMIFTSPQGQNIPLGVEL